MKTFLRFLSLFAVSITWNCAFMLELNKCWMVDAARCTLLSCAFVCAWACVVVASQTKQVQINTQEKNAYRHIHIQQQHMCLLRVQLLCFCNLFLISFFTVANLLASLFGQQLGFCGYTLLIFGFRTFSCLFLFLYASGNFVVWSRVLCANLHACWQWLTSRLLCYNVGFATRFMFNKNV